MTESKANGYKSTAEVAGALFEYGRWGRAMFRIKGVREITMQLPEADNGNSESQRKNIFSGPVTVVARRSRDGMFPYSISVIPQEDPESRIGISSSTANGAISDLRVGRSKAEDIFIRTPLNTTGRSLRVR